MRLTKYLLIFTILLASVSFQLLQPAHSSKVLAVVQDSFFLDQENKGAKDGSDNSLNGSQSNLSIYEVNSIFSIKNSGAEEQLPSYFHYLVTVFYQGNYMNHVIDHLKC